MFTVDIKQQYNNNKTIDFKLCIAITDILKICTCYFGGIGEEGNMGDGQAQHEGIIYGLQTQFSSCEVYASVDLE